VGFDKPEPLVDTTGNLGEDVRCVGVPQLVAGIEPIMQMMARRPGGQGGMPGGGANNPAAGLGFGFGIGTP
jgi:hypothetical protein